MDVLQTRGIHYKWKFPFCLSATTAGRTVLLKVPEDPPQFCDCLGNPMVQIPEWYAEFRPPSLMGEHHREDRMETQSFRYRRHQDQMHLIRISEDPYRAQTPPLRLPTGGPDKKHNLS